MAIYNTPQEKADVKLLQKMGFKVDNPNSPECSDQVKKIKNQFKLYYPGTKIMDYFKNRVKENDVLAFRALSNGDISAGVDAEIIIAEKNNIPVFEIPTLTIIHRKALNVSETREYLKNNRKRNK